MLCKILPTVFIKHSDNCRFSGLLNILCFFSSPHFVMFTNSEQVEPVQTQVSYGNHCQHWCFYWMLSPHNNHRYLSSHDNMDDWVPDALNYGPRCCCQVWPRSWTRDGPENLHESKTETDLPVDCPSGQNIWQRTVSLWGGRVASGSSWWLVFPREKVCFHRACCQRER